MFFFVFQTSRPTSESSSNNKEDFIFKFLHDFTKLTALDKNYKSTGANLVSPSFYSPWIRPVMSFLRYCEL